MPITNEKAWSREQLRSLQDLDEAIRKLSGKTAFPQLEIADRGDAPRFYITDLDNAADEKSWELVVDSNGQLIIRTVEDDKTAGLAGISITRTSVASIDLITLAGAVNVGTHLQLPTYTTTSLEDVTHAVNTGPGKVAGAAVFNFITGMPVYSQGSSDNSLWNDATGSAVHTPV